MTNMGTNMNVDVILDFFEREMTPQQFLDGLHEVMADYMILAASSQFGADERHARRIDFLECVHRMVSKSVGK